MVNIYYYNRNNGRYLFNEIVKKYNKNEILYRSNNRVKKGSIDQMRKDMIKYYQNNIMNFTEEEKELITTVINNIERRFRNLFPLITNWRFLLLTNEADKNLPYTLFDVIVLHKFPSYFRNASYLNELEELLFHEQIHILQRYNQKKFNDFYKKHWGFIPIKQIKNKWIEEHRITNPDSNDNLYIRPIDENENKVTYIIPQIIILNNQLEQIGIFIFYFKKSNKFKLIYDNNKLIKKKLDDISKINTFFNNINNKYCPNEIFCHSVIDIIYKNKNYDFLNYNDLVNFNNNF